MSVKEIQRLPHIQKDIAVYGISKPGSETLHLCNGRDGNTFCNKKQRSSQDKIYRIDVSVPKYLNLCSSCRKCKPYRIDKIFKVNPNLCEIL